MSRMGIIMPSWSPNRSGWKILAAPPDTHITGCLRGDKYRVPAGPIYDRLIIRILEGALTAGLFPAAMGVVADVVPENERAKWVGIVMGSYGDGLIVLGGLHHDYRR